MLTMYNLAICIEAPHLGPRDAFKPRPKSTRTIAPTPAEMWMDTSHVGEDVYYHALLASFFLTLNLPRFPPTIPWSNQTSHSCNPNAFLNMGNLFFLPLAPAGIAAPAALASLSCTVDLLAPKSGFPAVVLLGFG